MGEPWFPFGKSVAKSHLNIIRKIVCYILVQSLPKSLSGFWFKPFPKRFFFFIFIITNVY